MVEIVWVVGQLKDPQTLDWELGGVFATREDAIAACEHRDDCIWPETVGEHHPRDVTSESPDIEWPRR